MTTVSTWVFDDPDGAEWALRRLERLAAQELVVVEDASVVSWPAGRPRPRTYQAGAVTGAAGLSGAFWGLLFGVLFLLPLAGPAAGPQRAGLSRIGLTDRFLQRVRDRVVPGTSALFLLTHDAVVEPLADVLGGSSPGPLSAVLSGDEEAALQRAFAGGDPVP